MTMLSALKYNLSHIPQDSLRWQLVTKALGKRRAKGKACNFYWFKLPASIIWLFLVTLYNISLRVLSRALTVGAAWFAGYDFEEPFFDFSIDTLGDHYREYKQRADGSYRPFAPYQIVLPLLTAWLLYYLIFTNPSLGITVALWTSRAAIFVLTIFLIALGSKNPDVKKAKMRAKAAWNKACPTLEVQKRPVRKKLFNT